MQLDIALSRKEEVWSNSHGSLGDPLKVGTNEMFHRWISSKPAGFSRGISSVSRAMKFGTGDISFEILKDFAIGNGQDELRSNWIQSGNIFVSRNM